MKKSEEETELTEKTESTEESITDENSSERTESNENDYSTKGRNKKKIIITIINDKIYLSAGEYYITVSGISTYDYTDDEHTYDFMLSCEEEETTTTLTGKTEENDGLTVPDTDTGTETSTVPAEKTDSGVYKTVIVIVSFIAVAAIGFAVIVIIKKR